MSTARFKAFYAVKRSQKNWAYVPVEGLTNEEFARISARMSPEKLQAITVYRAQKRPQGETL